MFIPTRITQRYLASHFIGPFVLSTSFFVIFLLTFQLFRLIRIVTNKSVEVWEVLELMGHIAISFLPMAIPLSALFATIYTLNKMSEDSEIVAMRSFGLRKKDLFLPFLILSFFISGVIFVLNRNLIPHSKTQFKNTIIQLTSQGSMTDMKAGQFFTDIPGITLFSEEVSEDGTKMKEVFIQKKLPEGEQVIVAKKGALIKQVQDELRTPMLRLHLEKGNIVKSEKGRNLEKIIFEEYDFPITSGGILPGFVTKDSMRSNEELYKIIKQRKEKIAKIDAIEKPTPRQLGEKNTILKRLRKSELEFWGRYNTPLQVLLFIFLGFSLGIKRGRGRSKSSGSLGLFFLLGYYTLFFGGISLARKGIVPPAVVVYFPTVVFTIIGARFYKLLDWQS
ncbi:MAG: LptF/LptG family permease [Halobacteriovoraceae bacterium]|nr:LptF/LptG family permease [Halobacteriovoraceae bacterium]